MADGKGGVNRRKGRRGNRGWHTKQKVNFLIKNIEKIVIVTNLYICIFYIPAVLIDILLYIQLYLLQLMYHFPSCQSS